MRVCSNRRHGSSSFPLFRLPEPEPPSIKMQREQKITIREMRESGPTRLIVYCADYKCAHSVVVDVTRWAIGSVCPTWSRGLLARSAAIAGPTSSRSSNAGAMASAHGCRYRLQLLSQV
jgi:hypothetical protein